MSFDPFTVAAVATAAGAGGGGISALTGNRSIDAGIASVNESARTSLSQLAAKASLEKRQQIADAQRVLGRIRVARAESGNTLDGADRQTRIDSAGNVATIRSNYANGTARVLSERDAAISQLSSQRQNPLLAGLVGGLQGLSTGLTLSSGLTSLGAFTPALTAAEKSSALLGGEAMASFLTGVP